MRIAAFNGSPRGKKGNTQVLVEAFLEGARDAGAEAECVHLVEKRIKPCNACLSCWVKTPGRCAQNDDMAPLLDQVIGSDVVVFSGGRPVDRQRLGCTIVRYPRSLSENSRRSPRPGAQHPPATRRPPCQTSAITP